MTPLVHMEQIFFITIVKLPNIETKKKSDIRSFLLLLNHLCLTISLNKDLKRA